MAEITEHQAQFGSLDLQISGAAYGVDLAALAVTEEIEHGRPTAVLAWLERARAISARVPEVQPPADPMTADLLGQLRWVINSLEQGQTQGDDTDGLRRRRSQLQRTIRARSWTIQGPRAVGAIPTAAAIRAELDPACLVAIFGLHDQLHAVVLTRTQSWQRRLGTMAEVEQLGMRVNADFDVLAMDLVPRALRASARSSLAKGLRALDEIMLAPLDLPPGRSSCCHPASSPGCPGGSCRPLPAGR